LLLLILLDHCRELCLGSLLLLTCSLLSCGRCVSRLDLPSLTDAFVSLLVRLSLLLLLLLLALLGHLRLLLLALLLARLWWL